MNKQLFAIPILSVLACGASADPALDDPGPGEVAALYQAMSEASGTPSTDIDTGAVPGSSGSSGWTSTPPSSATLQTCRVRVWDTRTQRWASWQYGQLVQRPSCYGSYGTIYACQVYTPETGDQLWCVKASWATNQVSWYIEYSTSEAPGNANPSEPPSSPTPQCQDGQNINCVRSDGSGGFKTCFGGTWGTTCN